MIWKAGKTFSDKLFSDRRLVSGERTGRQTITCSSHWRLLCFAAPSIATDNLVSPFITTIDLISGEAVNMSMDVEKYLFLDDEDDVVRFFFPDHNVAVVDMDSTDETHTNYNVPSKGEPSFKVAGRRRAKRTNRKARKHTTVTGIPKTDNGTAQEESQGVAIPKDSGDNGSMVCKIKGYKSLLSQMSPVFETMFSENWNDSVVIMDDPVDFDQFEAFRLFLAVGYKLKNVDSLAVEDATRVYFYAHKYQMDALIKEIENFLKTRVDKGISKVPFEFAEMRECVKLAELYSLGDLKKQLDKVKVFIDDGNVLGLYEFGLDHGMEKLVEQIVKYLEFKPVGDKWPRDLMARVMEQNQKSLKKYQDMVDKHQDTVNQFRKQPLYCQHGNTHGVYRASHAYHAYQLFRNCSLCQGGTCYV